MNIGKYMEKTEAGNDVSFEIFASREIVAVLSELKEEADISEKKKNWGYCQKYYNLNFEPIWKRT